MRTLLIPAALLATAFVCSPLALAGTTPAASASTVKTINPHSGHRHHHRMHHRGHGMHALRKLDLTESQRSNIHQLVRENMQQARTGMSDLHQKRMALEKATPGTAAYQNAANDLAKAAASSARSRVMRRADLNKKIYGLLTAEQRTKLADMRAQRQARMEKWRASHKHHMTQPATATSTAK
ncbi:MAG TPA: Spy/CpxP family protein refolding chaperone [Oleiagrimonas sp.]|nr:Spy/CpxP family protein refolding chaperone [Oleiagrimonas sp.]